MSVNLIENDQVVSSLRHAAHHGATNLGDIPSLLKRVIKEDMWRERVVVKTGEVVSFRRFEEFVNTAPLEGLGLEFRLLKNLCRDDVEALDLLDQATKGKQGERTDLLDNIQEVKAQAPTGTSEAAALRRLRKDAPEIHKCVIAGELSAHAAMVQAGFRRKTIQIPADPEAAARALKRHFGPSELQQIIASLSGGEPL